MSHAGELEAAREAYHRRDWAGARERFRAAQERGELSADDAFSLADANWWLGLVDESLAAAEEAYRRYLHGDRPRQAAMTAMVMGPRTCSCGATMPPDRAG